MIRLVFKLIFLLFIIKVSAQESKKMTGGMMLHSGYLTFTNPEGSYKNYCSGIGGRIHFYLNPKFSLGSMGGSTHIAYENHSFSKFGYGGIHAQYHKEKNKIRITPGLLAGYGGITNYHIQTTPSKTDLLKIYDYSTFVIAPTFSIEYFLTNVISVILMGDYVVGNAIGESNSFKSPRIYFGILFSR